MIRPHLAMTASDGTVRRAACGQDVDGRHAVDGAPVLAGRAWRAWETTGRGCPACLRTVADLRRSLALPPMDGDERHRDTHGRYMPARGL